MLQPKIIPVVASSISAPLSPRHNTAALTVSQLISSSTSNIEPQRTNKFDIKPD